MPVWALDRDPPAPRQDPLGGSPSSRQGEHIWPATADACSRAVRPVRPPARGPAGRGRRPLRGGGAVRRDRSRPRRRRGRGRGGAVHAAGSRRALSACRGGACGCAARCWKDRGKDSTMIEGLVVKTARCSKDPGKGRHALVESRRLEPRRSRASGRNRAAHGRSRASLPRSRRCDGGAGRSAERAARESLRAQVARLEGELSGSSPAASPHFPPAPLGAPGCAAGPRLLSLPSWSVSATGWWCACAGRSDRPASARSSSCARATCWNGCGWSRAATSSCACVLPTSANAAAACGRCVPASA